MNQTNGIYISLFVAAQKFICAQKLAEFPYRFSLVEMVRQSDEDSAGGGASMG
jgi:hypothetical protein